MVSLSGSHQGSLQVSLPERLVGNQQEIPQDSRKGSQVKNQQASQVVSLQGSLQDSQVETLVGNRQESQVVSHLTSRREKIVENHLGIPQQENPVASLLGSLPVSLQGSQVGIIQESIQAN